MSYTFSLRYSTATTAGEILPLAGRVRSAVVSWGWRGCAECSLVVDLGIHELIALYEARGTPHLVVSWYGQAIWSGRVERPRLRAGQRQIELVAYGYGQALDDVPYTATWVDQSNANWRLLTPEDYSDAVPDRYEYRADNSGLYIAPRKNNVFGTTGTVKAGRIGYRIPTNAVEPLTGISFNGSLVATSTNWALTVNRLNYDWTSPVNVATINSVVGTVNLAQIYAWSTSLNVRAIMLSLYYSAADATFTGETGSVYLRVNYTSNTGPRVDGGTGASTFLLMASLINTAATANPSQLRNAGPMARGLSYGGGGIGGDGDRHVYTDAAMREIIETLEARWTARAWVSVDRELYWEPAGSAATSWRIEASDIEIERDLSRVRNRVAVAYTTGAGEYQTTDDADNAQSQDRYGVIRKETLAAPSTGGSYNTSLRTAVLADKAAPSQRAGVTIRRVQSRHGAPAPLHAPQVGDTARVVNAPSYTSETGSALSFRIARVELRLRVGEEPELILEPDEPTPRLETLLAQLGG